MSRYKNKRLSDMKDKQLYEAYPTSFLNEESPVTVEQHVAVLGHITRLLQSIMPPPGQEPTLFTEYLHEDDLSDITMFITEKYYGLSQELNLREKVNKEDDLTIGIGQESWVTLPASGASPLSMWTDGSIYKHDYLCTKEDGAVNQHLYLVSHEEIKEGDWYIDDLTIDYNVNPLQMKCYCNDNKEIIQSTVGTTSPVKTSKKIVATTNKTISTCSNAVVHPDNTKAQCVRGAQDCCGKISSGRYMMPQIPKYFVKHFVMKQGKVGNVAIELERESGKIKINNKGEIILNV